MQTNIGLFKKNCLVRRNYPAYLESIPLSCPQMVLNFRNRQLEHFSQFSLQHNSISKWRLSALSTISQQSSIVGQNYDPKKFRLPNPEGVRVQNSKNFESKPFGFRRVTSERLTKHNARNLIFVQASNPKQEVVSITYEEIGLFPRSFSRVLDRFLKQVFSDVDILVIQEYRFYRYLFLTTLKCLLILFFVPFLVNFLAKTYVVRPLTEYFWNTKQTQIFLNLHQQEHAFAELKEFEQKFYFESLLYPKSAPSLNVLSVDPYFIDDFSKNNEKPQTVMKVNKIKKGIQLFKTPSKKIVVFSKNFKNILNNRIQLYLFKVNWLIPFASDVDPFQNSKSFESTDSKTEGFRNQTGVKPEGFRIQLLATDIFYQKNLNDSTHKLLSTKPQSSLSIYNASEAEKNMHIQLQEKTLELAQRYNDQSVEAITHFFGDIVSLATFFYLLYVLEIQINITQSFLLEVFFGLDDSRKSLLILLFTDLLVGYHSSNLWELFFELFFNHYGLPESQTGIFLLVATLPVLLDVLFKYLIFRHLNRSSPATVATYHAMIE